LVLAVQLVRERAKRFLAPREQNAPPSPRCDLSRERRADAAGCAGDDRYLHTRTLRRAVTVRPDASRTVARNTCLPFFACFAFQSANASPAESAFFDPSFFASARNTTFFSTFVEPATTTSRVVE